MTAIDSYPITHDAFGRIVEFKSSPTYQILYAPTGEDLAVMNGQTIFYGKVPLPGGGRAVFTGDGLNDYTHVDWEGSARFGSTPSRTMLFDMAYAPYGEIYAKTGGGSAEAFTGQCRDIVGDEWDFLYRQEHSGQGRWISPDPAGMAAVDPTNPQSWNRYAYVGGNPLANVDPDGLVTLPGCEEGDWGCGLGGGGWGGCGALGGPEGDLCTLMLPPPSVLGGEGGGSGSGRSGADGTSAGSGGGTNGSGGTGSRIANFPNGESLGIPPGASANWGGILGAILPIDPSCEFGPCLPGGEPFAPGAGAVTGTVICEIAEPCGAIEDVVLVGTLAAEVGVLGYQYFARKADIKQFDHAVREIERICGKPLSPDQRRRLHEMIHGQDFGFNGIVQTGVGMFCADKQ